MAYIFMPLSDGIDGLCPAGGCLLLVTPAATALCSVGAFASPYNYRSKYVLLARVGAVGQRKSTRSSQM